MLSLRKASSADVQGSQHRSAHQACRLHRRISPRIPLLTREAGANSVLHAPARARAGRPCQAARAGVVSAASATSGGQAHSLPVIIVGAGIAGLAIAVALTKCGVPVRVLERAPGLRAEGAAIGLWANAWRALGALDAKAADTLRAETLRLGRIELVRDSGVVLRAFSFEECSGGADSEFRGVVRARLLEALYQALPDPGSIVSFETSLQGVTQPEAVGGGDAAPLRVQAVCRGQAVELAAAAVIGADGVGSVVASYLGLPPTRYAGYVALRGVAEFPSGLPAALTRDTIRQMWGAGVRAGTYPVSSTQVYWYACANAPQEGPGAARPSSAAERKALAASFVRGWAWQMEDVVAATPAEDISFAGMADRWVAGAVGRGCVSVAGDAAHPMTPNLGQGGCSALEDAVVLARHLVPALKQGAASPAVVASALRAYEAERAKRCLPLTVRANLMGAALQLPYAPVVFLRDNFVRTLFQPSHFLDHATYDCGKLPLP